MGLKQTICLLLLSVLALEANAAQKGNDDTLLKVYTGRWEISGPEGIEHQKKNSAEAVCSLKRSALVKELGAKKVEELIAAVAELYKLRDKTKVSMLFRQVDPSHELVGVHDGREFTVERLFSTRLSIESPETAKAYALVKEAEKLCK